MRFSVLDFWKSEIRSPNYSVRFKTAPLFVQPYEKESLNFAEVIGKLLSEEIRLKSKGHASTENSMLVASKGKKKNSIKNVVYWECKNWAHKNEL